MEGLAAAAELGKAPETASLEAQALFWQRFLAAEMPAEKGRALLETLDPSSVDALGKLDRFPALSPNERKRMDAASTEALESAVTRGVRVYTTEEIPGVYRHAPASPALFVDGEVGCLQAPTVAIVGTRAASTYGRAVAEKFAEALAREGVTIVSGGALGIDAAAHRGALNVGGSTVAVLAGGVDRIYPAVHAGLFRQIKENGCLISQFPVGSKPFDYRFLERNALIAALSLAVLVVEAPVRSGALRTAQEAGDLGREVFVVPANIDNLKFRGSFNLLRDGATLVDHPAQILESLGIEAKSEAARPPEETSDIGQSILAVLTVEPMAAELIVERTARPTSDVLSELTMLELEGRIVRDVGGYAKKP